MRRRAVNPEVVVTMTYCVSCGRLNSLLWDEVHDDRRMAWFDALPLRGYENMTWFQMLMLLSMCNTSNDLRHLIIQELRRINCRSWLYMNLFDALLNVKIIVGSLKSLETADSRFEAARHLSHTSASHSLTDPELSQVPLPLPLRSNSR